PSAVLLLIGLARSLHRSEFKDCLADSLGGRKLIDQKTCVDLHLAFVLRRIAKTVCLVENAPDAGRETEGMFERGENHIPLVGSITVPTQCGKVKRMRSIVSKIEPALQSESLVI